MSNGKGDTPRPLSVTPDTYAANYARIRWTEVDEDRREAMRQANLRAARDIILNAPPMSTAMREAIDKAWRDFDAAYPKPKDSL